MSAVAFLTLAGCVTEAPPEAAGADADETLAPEAGKGTIRGSVVDDSLTAIAGASVALDLAQTTVTDAAGAFVFSNVEPGPHQVDATSVLHQPGALAIEVAADQVVEVTLTLVPLASEEAYFETIPQSGLMSCGVGGAIPAAGNWTFAACGPVQWTGLYDIDRFMLDWMMATPLPEDHVGYFGETVWTSNQALSTEMAVIWWQSNVPYRDVAANAATYASGSLGTVAGRSPLNHRMDVEERVEAAEGVCTLPDACWMMSGHYPASHSFNTPADQTLIFQQRYTDYFTIFHNGELPETFTALPDG